MFESCVQVVQKDSLQIKLELFCIDIQLIFLLIFLSRKQFSRNFSLVSSFFYLRALFYIQTYRGLISKVQVTVFDLVGIKLTYKKKEKLFVSVFLFQVCWYGWFTDNINFNMSQQTKKKEKSSRQTEIGRIYSLHFYSVLLFYFRWVTQAVYMKRYVGFGIFASGSGMLLMLVSICRSLFLMFRIQLTYLLCMCWNVILLWQYFPPLQRFMHVYCNHRLCFE
eukprot:TRINITY_DN7485_c0_g1_i1.p3 TRINITY_DN7485_c0_g1~~TRINITY_DN7485_c0_g1_i1.p3  ORF type:complete len:222 (+),score=-2.77 TRINITY_DN7485_c0_g1_i1:72-737(+)